MALEQGGANFQIMAPGPLTEEEISVGAASRLSSRRCPLVRILPGEQFILAFGQGKKEVYT